MANHIDSERLGKMMQRILRELKSFGEPARFGELMERVEPDLGLTDWDRQQLEKSGYRRWFAYIQWFSVDCVKAGFLSKSGGKWAVTENTDRALKLPPAEFVREARSHARKVSEESRHDERPHPEPEEDEAIVRQATYEQVTTQAREQIEAHIFKLGPYDFQQLVAELLIGMGYHVPFVAPPGPDGGIDLIAYKDPLGTTTPRIRGQIKHRPSMKVSIAEVRALEGVLRKDGDMGLIVSSGGFTSESLREIQVSGRHIEAMDMDRLISLWQQHYERIRESGKLLLPLVQVHLLAPTEE